MRKVLQKLRVKIGLWKKQIMLGLLMGGVALAAFAMGRHSGAGLCSHTQRVTRGGKDYALEHPGVRHRELAWKMLDEGVVAVSASSVYADGQCGD